MTYIELGNQIFDLCIVPLLMVLSAYFVQLVKVKTQELALKTETTYDDKYMTMIDSTIANCVAATNQTYVESLKGKNAFDAEAQKVAFEKTLNAVLAVLTEDAKDYISTISGDLNTYLTQKIEAQVNISKK